MESPAPQIHDGCSLALEVDAHLVESRAVSVERDARVQVMDVMEPDVPAEPL